jgi:hypothetical protein
VGEEVKGVGQNKAGRQKGSEDHTEFKEGQRGGMGSQGGREGKAKGSEREGQSSKRRGEECFLKIFELFCGFVWF